MKKTPLYVFLLWVFMLWSAPLRAELIVLASPPGGGDGYYAQYEDNIVEFHLQFARKILANGDDVLILSHAAFYDDYVDQLGADKVLLAPMPDIWMRDFTVANPVNPVMFRYSAAGQGGNQSEADYVQTVFAAFLEEAGVAVHEIDLINDGGNFVDDYADRVVVSRKFLRDNDLSEQQARREIRRVSGARHVAFIEADEQGGLEHADGVVSFVDENVLLVNDYAEDPVYRSALHRDLTAALPDVKIHEVVTPYDPSGTYDARFGSACGLYTNALVTPAHIYFPQFGIPEDELALAQVRAATRREVVPVMSQGVCGLGGGVRCMSLQVRGEIAYRLLQLRTPAN